MSKIDEFIEFRKRMNEEILKRGSLNTKRFFNLDSMVYEDGTLSKKTKEFMGLCASITLRCDDCIKYHILELKKLNATDEELMECFDIALVVGGSITIPHIRRALATLIELKGEKNEEK